MAKKPYATKLPSTRCISGIHIGECVIWNRGERARTPIMRRPCPCGTCKPGVKGVGYLSSSNQRGQGFTIWIQDERMYKRMLKVIGGEK